MLQTLLPLSFIFVSALPHVYPVAFGLRIPPFADVRIAAVSACPHAVAMFEPFHPFTVIYFAVTPLVDTSSVSFAGLERSKVRVIIWVTFESFALSKIHMPFAFVLSPVLIAHYAFTIANGLRAFFDDELTEIYRAMRFIQCVIIFPNLETFQLYELYE
jgi:hypothetical protein